eukprot:3463575-Pyramimonas_sp.AAC.1
MNTLTDPLRALTALALAQNPPQDAWLDPPSSQHSEELPIVQTAHMNVETAGHSLLSLVRLDIWRASTGVAAEFPARLLRSGRVPGGPPQPPRAPQAHPREKPRLNPTVRRGKSWDPKSPEPRLNRWLEETLATLPGLSGNWSHRLNKLDGVHPGLRWSPILDDDARAAAHARD